ncbi:MAG: Microtubule-nucleating Tub4p (gamma-tubulin) complex component [Chrysothrix sp. TS-e1954]|nr:MAG: Microtubule-nucleating Tub4p (gamma-tubulin) complex component [Chrysothrix sp. TS-e1954]
MSNGREQRISDALGQLIDRSLPLDDTDASNTQYARALEAAQDILEDSGDAPTIAGDVYHTRDLINRRLIQDNDTPQRSLRFQNLFSRLLVHPVLSQKWAILHLLHQISDTDPTVTLPDGPIRPSPKPTPSLRSVNVSDSMSNHGAKREDRVFDEAFSRQGLSSMANHTSRHGSPRPSQIDRSMETPRRPRKDEPAKGSALENDRLRDHDPSEAALLRDIPFTLQGVSSTNLKFSSTNTLEMPRTLPAPIIALLHTLAEPSLLYKSLSTWLESQHNGLVEQSLRAAIGVELRSYLGLVATLEGQIRQALASTDISKKGLGRSGVTLRRCVIWTREATMGLRLMSLVVEEAKNRRGCQIISLIHSFSSSHGDPFVGAFAERLLSHVTRPFYDMLRQWIYDGELADPYHEFFVSEQQEKIDDGRGRATSVWEDKYKLDEGMIPSIVTAEFAKKVFLIGKSLNFIRYACGDSEWVENYSKAKSQELHYGDTASLISSIDEAYRTTMAQLISLMTSKFKLIEHLTALKKYLMLSQGDFVALLMESLASNLDRPANSQYRHTLTAQLEHSIRNSNAQYESEDVLQRLDARMLELSHGEIGWDVFTLEYKIDAPVDVIVTPHASKQYLKVFNFLWRVKRVEFALASTWRRAMTGARSELGAVADKTGKDWQNARCVIAEMIHFVTQLQYYILFEVIEASWETLQKALDRPEVTLDDMIQAHARYLRSITHKGLLGSSGYLDFPTQLHELLKLMLAYTDALDGLYGVSLHELSRRDAKAARIDSRTRAGKWGVTEKDEDDDFDAAHRRKGLRSRDTDSPLPPPLLKINGDMTGATDSSVLPALRVRMGSLASDFRAKISGLLGDLAYQPDPDMRFLGVVMNFNDTYKVVRRSRRTKPTEKDDEKGETKGKEIEKEKTSDEKAAGQTVVNGERSKRSEASRGQASR